VLREGRPAERLRLLNGWSWFTLRRADGPDGVVLEIRIPGYRNEDLPCEDQAAAREAAEKVYDGYRQAAEGLAS
jgi:hypothetical protein